MAAKPCARGASFLTIRKEDDQPKLDIAAMAGELSRSWAEHARANDEEALRVLFDWSAVTSWPYAVSSHQCLLVWRETVPKIFRAAFVHDRRWDRHAAILSALLRSANTQVLCFPAIRRADAIVWLVSSDDGSSRSHSRPLVE
jgi:hypothetical protein